MTNDKKQMMPEVAEAIWECRRVFARAILAHDDVTAVAVAVRWRENVAVGKVLISAGNPKGAQ